MIHEGIRKLKLEKYPVLHLDDRVKELAAFRDTLSVEVAPYDALVTVVLDLKGMEMALRTVSKGEALKDEGMLFMLYPKKGNKHYESFIHRDHIFKSIPVEMVDCYMNIEKLGLLTKYKILQAAPLSYIIDKIETTMKIIPTIR